MVTNMSEKLKRCPFCGAEARVKAPRRHDLKMFYVMCSGCGNQTDVLFNDAYFNRDGAIAAWNRRVDDIEELHRVTHRHDALVNYLRARGCPPESAEQACEYYNTAYKTRRRNCYNCWCAWAEKENVTHD